MERRRRRRAREKSRRSEHNINQFNALCSGAFIIYFSSFFFWVAATFTATLLSEQNQIIKCREGERESNKMRWGGGGESESTSFSTHTLVT